MTQAATTTTTASARAPVQKRETDKAVSGGALRGQLRGMSFAEGEAALAPVQKKDDKKKDDKTPPAEPHALALKEGTVEKLGQVESFEQANTVVGEVLDAMAPSPGSGFAGSFQIKICPPGALGFYLDFGLEGTVKRTAAGKLEVDGKSAITAGVGGGGNVDLGWFGKYGAQWHVGIRGALGAKATGSNGAECMSLLGLAIKGWIEALPGGGYVSGYLFDEGFEAGVLAGMGTEGTKDEDSIETSWEGGLDVGGSLQAGQAGGGELQGIGGKKSVTKVGKGADGKRTSETEEGLSGIAKFAGKVGEHWASEGEVQYFNPKGPKKPTVEIKVEVLSHGTTAAKVAFGVKALADLFGPAWSILKSAGDAELAQAATDYAGAVPGSAIAGALDESHLLHSGFAIGLKYEEGKLADFTLEAVRGVEKEIGGAGAQATIKGKTTRTLLHGTGQAEGGHP